MFFQIFIKIHFIQSIWFNINLSQSSMIRTILLSDSIFLSESVKLFFMYGNAFSNHLIVFFYITYYYHAFLALVLVEGWVFL